MCNQDYAVSYAEEAQALLKRAETAETKVVLLTSAALLYDRLLNEVVTVGEALEDENASLEAVNETLFNFQRLVIGELDVKDTEISRITAIANFWFDISEGLEKEVKRVAVITKQQHDALVAVQAAFASNRLYTDFGTLNIHATIDAYENVVG